MRRRASSTRRRHVDVRVLAPDDGRGRQLVPEHGHRHRHGSQRPPGRPTRMTCRPRSARSLPEPTIVNGTARLRGPSGCVKGPFKATVRGSRIARVTFFVDGKRFKRISAPNGEGSQVHGQHQPEGPWLRRPPRDRAGGVRGGVADPDADAAAQLPALQEAGREAALHRLSGGWSSIRHTAPPPLAGAPRDRRTSARAPA